MEGDSGSYRGALNPLSHFSFSDAYRALARQQHEVRLRTALGGLDQDVSPTPLIPKKGGFDVDQGSERRVALLL